MNTANSLPQEQNTGENQAENVDIAANKDVAAFSYLWIFSVIVLFLRKDSRFIQFHAKQATVLFVLSVVLFIVPVVGKYLVILAVAAMIIGFINATQGEYYNVPIVAGIVSGGVSPSSLGSFIGKSVRYFGKVMKAIFIKEETEEKDKTVKIEGNINDKFAEKIRKLERRLYEIDYLTGILLENASADIKAFIQKIYEFLLVLDKDVQFEKKKYLASFKKKNVFITAGKIQDNSLILAVRVRDIKSLQGFTVSYSYSEWTVTDQKFYWAGIQIVKENMADLNKLKVLIEKVYKENF